MTYNNEKFIIENFPLLTVCLRTIKKRQHMLSLWLVMMVC